MASVALSRLWLNLAADLAQALDLPLRAVEHSPGISVDVRARAGGNFQAVRRPGRQKQSKVTLGFLTDDQVETLNTWHGELVCARFPDGEKYYGVYTDPAFNPRPGPVGTPTTLSLVEVTVSEEV